MMLAYAVSSLFVSETGFSIFYAKKNHGHLVLDHQW